MLKDFKLNEHLLLIGNQGVGKNKIVDKFLQLLNLPREYIQLHRDSTVHTLTSTPMILDGVLVFQDSALVKAVREGFVLVVDEADKVISLKFAFVLLYRHPLMLLVFSNLWLRMGKWYFLMGEGLFHDPRIFLIKIAFLFIK